MDRIFLDLALLTIVTLVFFFFAFFFFSKRNKLNLPAGSAGWPIVGEMWEYLKAGQLGAPHSFFLKRMASYSPAVFRTKLIGQDMAVFCGPAGNKFLFTNEHKYVGLWLPKHLQKVVIFALDSSKEAVEKEAMELRSNLLPEFLRPEALKDYIPLMDAMAKDHLEEHWSPYKEVKVFLLSKTYSYTFGCNLLMSVTDPKQIARMHGPFKEMVTGLSSLPINFPGTPFNRAVKASRIVGEDMLAVVKQRRRDIMENQETANRKDILGKLLEGSEDDGMVAKRIIGFLLGSYHTLSTAITFTISHIAQYPHVYERVFQEQMEIAKSKAAGEALNWQDIQKMKYSWCVVCESMRLMPPSKGSFRQAITDFTYEGVTIPKGWKTHWTVHTTHRNPKYFPEPEKFDPSRFEGKGPAPYTFVPFGGGPRMCPGREYARLEILSFIHNVVTKFKFSKVDPKEKVIYRNSPFPANGLLIRLEPLGN
ncbi:hypothetical protein Tsubulata_044697 [Turnera subulata]|uniref:Cytochrome P450 n=1 Tax=Turnera subulata TaxID=218843 RepID=A0A9Q0EY93_9ROSI|nr:hypothetical protein Tsubulata_044697 [Turnera subulata]